MTESAPAHPDESLPLDSTAQLLTRITAQLGTQLSRVSLNGTRRAAQAPASGAVRRFAAGVATTEQRLPRAARRASA